MPPRSGAANNKQSTPVRSSWQELLNRNLSRLRRATTPGQPQNTDFHIGPCDGFYLLRFSNKSPIATLLPESCVSTAGSYYLYAPVKGQLSLSFRNAEHQFGDEAMCLMDSGMPHALGSSTTAMATCFILPKAFVDQRVAASSLCGQLLDANQGCGRMAWSMLQSMADELSSFSPSTTNQLCRQIAELIILCLQSQPALQENGSEENGSLLESIKSYVRQQACSPDLKPDSVAVQFNISVRYLHKLFQNDDNTLCEFIKHERLQHATQLLSDPAYRSASITDIAYSCCFSSSAHFSDSFRKHFGLCPSEYRQQHFDGKASRQSA